MTDTLRVGLDLSAGKLRIAQVSHQLGRPEIVSLSDDPGVLTQLVPGIPVGLSMPDDEALVKTYRLSSQGEDDLRLKVYFELTQSVLEPEDRFHFACIDTGNRHQIGLIYRRERIEARRELLRVPASLAGDRFRVELRSIALARAYLHFCKTEPGDLVALATVSDGLVSVVLLHRQKVVALGNAAVGPAGQSSGEFRPTAIALKTLINFKLASIHEDGITIPPATLIISGEGIGDLERSILQGFFSARVVPFSPLPALGEAAARGGQPDAGAFLIALGLTVN